MKKLLSLMAAICLVLTLSGCGNNAPKEDKTPVVEPETKPEEKIFVEPMEEKENADFANSFIKSFTTTTTNKDVVSESYLSEKELNLLYIGHSQNLTTNNVITDFNKVVKDNEGISLKAIYVDGDTEQGFKHLERFTKLFKTDFDIIYPSANLKKNLLDSITEYPTVVFLDNKGNKVAEDIHITERADIEQVQTTIDSILVK